MKLIVKDLKGRVFPIEAQPNDKMATLKIKIQGLKGIPADTIKLSFKGKTLNNDDTVEKIGIKDTDFIVCSIQAANSIPKSKGQGKVEEKKQKKEQQKREESKEQEKREKKQQEKREEPRPTQSQEQEEQINELMGMGYPRQECEVALRAASYRIEKAVDYLINGIPQSRERPSNPPQQVQPGEQSTQMGILHLRSLFQRPEFSQLREVLRNNPAAMGPIMQQINQVSPQIYNLIMRYPEEFHRIIQGENQADVMSQRPSPGSIVVTPADEHAINRLHQLGFSKIQSAQTYFACDRNQQQAANMLFDRLANGDIEVEPRSGASN